MVRSRSWRRFTVASVFAMAAACASLRSAPLANDAGPSAGDDAASTESDAGAADASSPFVEVSSVAAGEAFTAIWVADKNNRFVVGTNGVHDDYTAGGWNLTYVQQGCDYNAVWGTSATDVYAVGTFSGDGTGTIEHYDGNAWTQVFRAPSGLYGIWGTKEFVIATGAKGAIYGKMPGSDWQSVSTPLPANPNVDGGPDEPLLFSVAGTDINHFAIAADLDRLFEALPSGDFLNLDPVPDRTIAFQTVWSTTTNPPSYFFGTNYLGLVWLSAAPIPDAAVIADNAYTIRRDDSRPGADQLYTYGIWGTNAKILCVGSVGTINLFDVGAQIVTPIPSPVPADLFGIAGSSTSDVWIVGQHETILHGAMP